jgi:hypothetical protein
MEELYRRQLWRAWRSPSTSVLLTDIPVAKAQLQGRMSDGGAFDGGRTATWLAGLKGSATWRAVRDARTGHTIHVVSNRSHDELTADLTLGLRILNWLSNRPVVWYWWDQPWTRELPANVDPGRDHVNGGWAVPGILEVHVYRREEAHKVMIHEAIHALDLDVSHEAVTPVRQTLEAEFGRSLWPHLGEAFTELYAEWLWSIARATSLREASDLWTAQMRCSEGQAAVVWARIRDSVVDEDTNVFAYYVLKWVLMRWHLTTVLLNPGYSVTFWANWWRAARPTLEELAQKASSTEQQSIAMGMTCLDGRDID